MNFIAPERLFLLTLVAVLGGTYLVLQFRSSKFALRFTNLELLDSVAPNRARWRRHVVAAAFMVALAAMVVALARPSRTVEVATERSTVVLAIDTSISMRSMDVSPSRLDAARDAATDFVDLVPEGIDIGLVAFDGAASSASPVTGDRKAIKDAIAGLSLGEGTAIGEAIFLGLDSIDASAEDMEKSADASEAAADEEPAGRIIVMSDGETTLGRGNDEAVAAALAAGIPVSTIAYGTDAGIVVYQGEEIQVPVNRIALRDVADSTGGTFFEAATGEELQAAFENIGTAIAFETEEREFALWFVGLGLLLGTVAGAGSLFWFSRLP